MQSNSSKVSDLSLSPCDNCEMSAECGSLLKCCLTMNSFIEQGVVMKPTEPTHAIYDKIFGKQYRERGYRILSSNALLEQLNCEDSMKSQYMSVIIRDLYESSTLESLQSKDDNLFLEWDWLFAVSRMSNSNMVMGAVGFERHGDGTYVSYLYVRKHYQGMGIGSDLLSPIENKSKRVCLLPENDSACKWYKSRGYQQSQVEDNTWIKETVEQTEYDFSGVAG